MSEDLLATANDDLRALGYQARDLAVHPAPRGKALLKGNKLLSHEPETLLRVVRELVPTSTELGTGMLRPADLRASL